MDLTWNCLTVLLFHENTRVRCLYNLTLFKVIFLFHVLLNSVSTMNTHRKLFDLVDKTELKLSSTFVINQKTAGTFYPLLRAMFRLFEYHCIYPFLICICISMPQASVCYLHKHKKWPRKKKVFTSAAIKRGS